MNFHDYLAGIAVRLSDIHKENDTTEYLRITILVRDVANDVIKKLEKKRR
jgi:hypothetical protein